jgi:hypothetical protein
MLVLLRQSDRDYAAALRLRWKGIRMRRQICRADPVPNIRNAPTCPSLAKA